jgi:hypothetical protein
MLQLGVMVRLFRGSKWNHRGNKLGERERLGGVEFESDLNQFGFGFDSILDSDLNLTSDSDVML